VNCSSNVYGGAIYWSGDKAKVNNCSFMNCSAGEEAGAILFCGSNPSISNSYFVNNFVIGEGSAIRINHVGRISNCTFLYNKLSATLNSIDYNNKGVMNFIFNRVGANNYFDAIHALVLGASDFYNITYYYNGSILNSNTVPIRYSINNNYDGLILIVEIYDGNTLVDNVSLISDDTGNVEYDYTYLSDGNYTYKAYHPNGGYYIYTESTGNFICKHIKPNVTVTVSNVTYGDYPVVNLTSDVEGNYSLVVAGKYYGIYELNKNNNLSILIPVTELLNGGNDYIASVEFDGYSIYAPASANTTFNINQALSNFNATSTGSEYYYGQDIIFIVELPSDATGNVTFYCLNRTVGEINNISQQKSLNLSIWNADTYTIQAKYSGDNNYENSTKKFTFKVNTINNMIKVIADSVEYPNEVNIRVNATVDGVYVIDINGTKYNVTANGQGINLKLAAGNYFANITNKSDVNHIFIPINTTFAVSKAINHVEVIVADKILPGATNVTVKATVDGVYTVVINGTYSVDVNVSGGTGSGSVDLPAGKLYFATTSFVHQNYTSEIINSTFDVDKGINNINVVVDNVVYPNEVNIRVNATVRGVYVIDIKGTKYNVTANGGGINVKLAAGNYFADIVNVTDEDYIFITNNATFVIDKKPTSPDEINITDLGNTTSGNATLIIKVPNNLTGNITITIGDKNYTAPIINGTANVDLNDLMPNNYTATVTYQGDENNTLISKNITIKIDKANLDLQINITQGNLTEPTILDFTVPVDFDGKITVEINNNTQEVILINGKGSISVNLDYGNFTAYITAVNSTKYYDLTITENIDVVDLRIPLNPETVIIITTNISNNSTISLNLPEDANGEVYMMVDSIIYLNSTVNNGTINPIALTNISPGNHIIFIYYTGDNKYQPMNKTFNITIPVITLKGVDLTVLYSGQLLYKVQVLSDGKNITDGTSITIIFNNNKFTVQTKGGYATLLLQSELKPDTYKVTANYTNITTTNNIVIKNIINAKKLKKLKKSKKVNKVKASLIKVDGKYLKGKKLTLKIKGKKVATAKTNKKGTATFKIKKKKLKKFKKGKYTASVIYGQDIYNKKIKIV